MMLVQDSVVKVSAMIGDHLDIVPQGLELDRQTCQLPLQSAHLEMTCQADDSHA
jgi:hypothetical protein